MVSDALAWKNISLWCGGTRGKLVLRDVSGSLQSWRLLGCLGPSGSGKTSLLDILASRLEKRKGQRLYGHINKSKTGDSKIAYVPQDAAFFSLLTVRETVSMCAQLDGYSGKELDEEVASTLRRLGLMNCSNTYVGGDAGGVSVKGISGGEKRRLSIACESVGRSGDFRGCIILVDEPTTGLDAFQADRVVDKLRELAHEEGAAVAATLHQPRSTAFHKIDDLLILSSGGAPCYFGEASRVLDRIARPLGKECPQHHNPAEFLIDLVSIDTTSSQAERQTREEVLKVQTHWRSLDKEAQPAEQEIQKKDAEEATESRAVPNKESSEAGRRPPGPLKVFGLLLGRARKQMARDMFVNITRAVSSMAIGVAFGVTHFRLGKGQKSIQARASVLVQLCINSAMISMVKSLNNFPRERLVVSRELARGSSSSRGRGGYGFGPYLLSKVALELPLDALFPSLLAGTCAPLCNLNPSARFAHVGILGLLSAASSSLGMLVGAASPSVETALAAGPCFMVLNIMLADTGGLFAEVPQSLKPLTKASIIKWGLEGCLVAEFRNSRFTADVDNLPEAQTVEKESRWRAMSRRRAAEQMCLTDGEQILKKFQVDKTSVMKSANSLAFILFANFSLSFLALKLRGARAKPQPMEEPTEDGPQTIDDSGTSTRS